MPGGNLVARIAEIPVGRYDGAAYRHMAPKYATKPLSGEGARYLGGRWNPRGIATLYLGTDRATAIAELVRLARRGGRSPDDFLPRTMIQYEVALGSVLDLRDPSVCEVLGMGAARLCADDLTACQAVGAAARLAGREAVIAPSAAGEGSVLAIYPDQLVSESAIRVVAKETWSALPTE